MITNEPQVNVTDIVFGKRPLPSTQESRSGYVNVDRGESSSSGIDLSNYYTKSEVDELIEGIEAGEYIAGENIQISPDNVISAIDTKYNASDFDIKDLADSTNLKYKWNNKQDTLTAGNNISIEDNVISAEDPDLSEYYTKTEVNNIINGIDIPEYTAGSNVTIDSNNVISATDTTYTASDFDIKDLLDVSNLKSTWSNKQDQLTAGENVSISNNVISATDTTYTASDFDIKDLLDTNGLKSTWSNKQDALTAGSNISINNGTISATDTTYQSSDFDIKDLTDSTDLKSTWNNKQDRLTSGTNITIENNVISATGGDGLKQVDLTTYADGVEGEIVQHIGSTTEDYIHGYIYKLSPGHVDRYEDIIIPSRSKKIIYTNKFDQSQKIVYTVEDVDLGKYISVPVYQNVNVYLLDTQLRNNILNSSGTSAVRNSTAIVTGTNRDLAYSVYDTLVYLYKSITGDKSISGTDLQKIREFYEYVTRMKLQEGMRLTTDSEAAVGYVNDLILKITIPLVMPRSSGKPQQSTNTRLLVLSDLIDLNWDITQYISQIYSITLINDQWCYDNTRDVTYGLEYEVFEASNGSKYVMYRTGASGSSSNKAYYSVSSDGESELYILAAGGYKHIVYGKPVSSSDHWCELVDVDILFNYNVSFSTASDSITIHKRVNEYDEDGFPINYDTSAHWNRIDVQPANQLTAGDGITIDSNNVISANLWTSVTD